MGLTFYPIEDTAVLNRFRQGLCPFMKAIQKTTETKATNQFEIGSICDEIIRAARSNQINNQLSRLWYHFIRNPLNRTLESEHDSLMAINLE